MESIRHYILRILSLLMGTLLLLPPCSRTASAGNVENSLVVGIQSSKTLTIRPLLPVERDMLSVYDLVYESLIYIDDDYVPRSHSPTAPR